MQHIFLIFSGDNWDCLFSHLCLYKIGFFPMLETSILHDLEVEPLVLGKIHLKVEEKESIMSQSTQDREIAPEG